MTARYAGALLLARRALIRDRLLFSLWLAPLLLIVFSSATTSRDFYGDATERASAARAINDNPALVALYGPILDEGSLGELAMTKVTVVYTVILALMFAVLVRRHTRSEEESGRAELVGATAIGRDALVMSAALGGAAIAVLAGSLAAAADVAAGLPVAGSMVFGASWVGIGLVGTGVSAAACQLAASSRTCLTISSVAIGLLYLMRAVGDLGPQWLSWSTPFGWNTRLQAWTEPRWWLLLAYVPLAAIFLACGLFLRARRDLGSGMFSARPGRPIGSRRLSTAFALVWRTNRNGLAIWTLGVVLLGTLVGLTTPSIGDLLNDESGQEVFYSLAGRGGLEDAFVATFLSIVAVLITCHGVAVVGGASRDELEGRLAPLLSSGLARHKSIAAVGVMSLVGATWLLAMTGTGLAIGLGHDADKMLGAALAQAPGVWCLLSLAVLLYAANPRWLPAAWALVGYFFVVGQLGEAFDLPSWIVEASPYQQTPDLPLEAFDPLTAASLTVLCAFTLIIAWLRFRSRDLA